MSYILSGILMSTIKHKTPPIKNTSVLPVGRQIKEGMQWVYQHRYLRPLALNTHAWFLFHSMMTTVLVTYTIIELGFSSLVLGVALGAAGIGAVCGTTISPLIGQNWGVGRSISFARFLFSPAVILIAMAPPAANDLQISALILVLIGQFVYGFAMGVEGPLEMGYRQSITPTACKDV